MPSFGRLGKHSNRSSQALAEPRSSSKTSTAATSTTSSATRGSAATGAATLQAAGHQRQPSHQLQQDQLQHQKLLDEADSAAHSTHSGHGFGHLHNANAGTSNPANSSLERVV
ncbi:hypothetical protein FALBO_14616 [Fusarium albosuccineum]|uniref:Uncharacterized protein n=1 Tax=Fusarium albosuccineum TaxID=1237068 RepID=A0A8H4KZF1_9HYPO|nr:hypothetical protein FALBO_14616 [Fusarium albosuccineum]